MEIGLLPPSRVQAEGRKVGSFYITATLQCESGDVFSLAVLICSFDCFLYEISPGPVLTRRHHRPSPSSPSFCYIGECKE